MKRTRFHHYAGALYLAASILVADLSSGRDTAGPAKSGAAPAAEPTAPVIAPTAPPPVAVAPPPSPPAPAEAASSASRPPDAAEQAKHLYRLGAEAFAAQREEEAIRYFRRAAEIVPSSKLTYNIALAYEEMGDTGRALAEYRSYLRQEQDDERREEVLGRVRELETKLAEAGVQQLSVLSKPAGATVKLGQRVVGVTPWSGELLPGLHQVSVELTGHLPRQAEVAVTPEHAAELTLELELEPEIQIEKPQPSALGRVAPLTWSLLGVGVGALTGGMAFELSRAESDARAGRATSSIAAAEERGAADAKQMASLLLLGFGSGFLISGGVLMILDLNSAETPPKASAPGVRAGIELPCAPGFCGVLARGSF